MNQETEAARPGSLLVIFLTVFIDLLGFGLVLPLLPIYASMFPGGEAGWTLGMLMASFSVMQFIFAPIWGGLSDRIGRRPVLIFGLASSAVFYTLFGFATMESSLVLIFVARIGAGIAGATLPTAYAYIADTTTPDKRARGMALIGVAFGIGFTFGPLLGFLAIPSGEGDPGPWPGFVAAGLSAGAMLLAIFLLPESRTPSSESALAHRKWINFGAIAKASRSPVIISILISIFICVFSFAKFETTLSLLLKKGKAPESSTTLDPTTGPVVEPTTEQTSHTLAEQLESIESPFGQFTFRDVCLTFAFIGFTLMFIQGGIVRPLSLRISERKLAIAGAIIEVIGFAMVGYAILMENNKVSVPFLYVALVVIVTGFSCLQPSLNSLLSRAAKEDEQGAIMGLGQSVNALARIFGSLIGIPLLLASTTAPYFAGAGLMLLGAILLFFTVKPKQ